jgi:hypothetical protein
LLFDDFAYGSLRSRLTIFGSIVYPVPLSGELSDTKKEKIQTAASERQPKRKAPMAMSPQKSLLLCGNAATTIDSSAVPMNSVVIS